MINLKALLENPELPDWYLIGETAHNHAGDFDYALRAVKELGQMQVHAIKIHLNINLSSYASKDFKEKEVYDLFIWPAAKYGKLIDEIHAAGKEAVCLANDIESVEYLIQRNDVEVIELHAVSLYDVPLLERLADYNGVLMLGVGGSSDEEMKRAIARLEKKTKKTILLMYGFQQFPTDPATVHLTKALDAQKRLGREIGYADHTWHADSKNAFLSVISYAMGLRVLEKHHTPDPGLERIDYQSSVGKETFDEIVTSLNLIKALKGNAKAPMSDAEKSYGQYGVMKKAIVATRDLKKGQTIKAEDLCFKRTSIPTSDNQLMYDELLGKRLKQNVLADDMINLSMIE